MKEKLTRNIGLKILSILLALLLWIVIANIDDPFTTVTFRDVKVHILNEDAITSLDEVYDIVENETVDFTIKGRETVVSDLTADDFLVTADLQHISDVNAVPIDISCPGKDRDIDIIRGRYPVMKISREKADEQSFKVNIVEIGEVAEGYYLCEKTASPNMIKISGPKTRIDRIEDLVVEVDVTNATESFKTVGTPVIYDANGEVIDAGKLTLSADNVSITLGIYRTKTINLYIKCTGEVAEGYEFIERAYEPKQVVISGPEDILKTITSLVIEEDITGFNETVEKEISLLDYLPDGIVLVGNDTTVAVKITIEKLETKEYIIYPSEITIRNNSSNRKVDYRSVSGIIVKVEGRSGIISALSRMELKPYIDIINLTNGEHEIPVRFDLPSNIKLVNEPRVTFTITDN